MRQWKGRKAALRKLNRVNRRKEFFSVSIEDIERALDKMDIDALISRIPSADEYYQSIKIQQESGVSDQIEESGVSAY